MKYQVEPRRDNINRRTVYIPQPAGGQPLDRREISRRINNMCTVTPADVSAVLDALESVIGNALAQGDSVRLGSLGSFHLRMSARSAATPEEVTSANIKEVGVAFRATPELKQRLAAARLERVEPAKENGATGKAAEKS